MGLAAGVPRGPIPRNASLENEGVGNTILQAWKMPGYKKSINQKVPVQSYDPVSKVEVINKHLQLSRVNLVAAMASCKWAANATSLT